MGVFIELYEYDFTFQLKIVHFSNYAKLTQGLSHKKENEK